jgi:hypothetical protein
MGKRSYEKPVLQHLGLLRELTKFSGGFHLGQPNLSAMADRVVGRLHTEPHSS